MKQTSVLVVDSDPRKFDLFEILLAKEGCQLHYASSSRIAVSSLDLFNPNVILLDMLLPTLDRATVCAQIKSMPKWSAVPLIILTNVTSKAELARCLQAGADDFISKPANPIEIRARIELMLQMKRQYDDLRSDVAAQQTAIKTMTEHLQKLRSHQVYTLSQELSTPVSTVLATLNGLIMGFESLSSKEIWTGLNESRQSAGRLQELTDHLVRHYVMQTSKPTYGSCS